MRQIALAAVAALWAVAPAPGHAAATETVLYSFKGGTDGTQPMGDLQVGANGVLYGTTYQGGGGDCSGGCGVVFQLTPPPKGKTGWTETVIYRFKGGTDGIAPVGGLIADQSGNLYGSTSYGGDKNEGCIPSEGGKTSCGTVFELTPPAKGKTAWTETVLYRFQGGEKDGAAPNPLIADSNGNLYGVATNGGTNGGIVFMLAPPAKGQVAWVETVLHSFTGFPDGLNPNGRLLRDGSEALYGVTTTGGQYSSGVVFKVTPSLSGSPRSNYANVYVFKGGADGNAPDAGLIAGPSGALYGTTTGGGLHGTLDCPGLPLGCGLVFKLSPSSGAKTTLYMFKPTKDASNPTAILTRDANGALYSATENGGSGDFGSVFKVTPPPHGGTWSEAVVYSFNLQAKGWNPLGGLAAGTGGTFYGTTFYGGTGGCTAGGCGTVFELTP
jgi:hypothetical protein